MAYKTVFDSTTIPFEYGSAIALLALGAVLLWWGISRLRNFRNDRHDYGRPFRTLLLIAVGIGLFALVGDIWRRYESMQSTAKGEQAKVVEGILQDHWAHEKLVTSRRSIRFETVEHFRISNVTFEFTRRRSEGHYFTNAPEHRLELQDGMRLRVTYVVRNGIVKLEVAQ